MNEFGAATLTGPKFKKRQGARFDCGQHGKLTATEIARMAGTSREAIWQRARAGVRGEALCAKKDAHKPGVKKPCTNPVVLIAVKLARAFPHRPADPGRDTGGASDV